MTKHDVKLFLGVTRMCKSVHRVLEYIQSYPQYRGRRVELRRYVKGVIPVGKVSTTKYVKNIEEFVPVRYYKSMSEWSVQYMCIYKEGKGGKELWKI